MGIPSRSLMERLRRETLQLRWCDVDNEEPQETPKSLRGVSRKTVSAMVAADEGRASERANPDARGRLSHVPMWFCREWIDEFLEARSGCAPLNERVPSSRQRGNSLQISPVDAQQPRQVATALRQPT